MQRLLHVLTLKGTLPPMPRTEMPSAVIDTNVALDMLLFDNPEVAPLADAIAQGQLTWLACPRMGDELLHVLSRGLAEGWHASAEEIHRSWCDRVSLHPPPTPGWHLHCSDSDDQVFIDLALARQATWLISRDRAVLKLARRALRQGVSIVTPAGWRAAWTQMATLTFQASGNCPA